MYLLGLLIVPAYFLALFARHGVWLAGPGDILRSLGAALVFLPSHLPSPEMWEHEALFPLDAPAWSLMLEVAVNLAYVLVLPWLSQRALVFIVLASGLLLIAAGVPYDGLDLGWSWPTLWWGFPRVAFSFFLGVLIHRTKIPRPAVPPVLVLAAVPLLFYAPPHLAVLVGFPMLLIAATRPGARQSHVMAAIGALSYPLYVIHFPLLHWLKRLFAAHPPWEPYFVPAAAALVILGAVVALKLWDEPARRYLSRRSAPVPQVKPALP
jgi:peptidoglycan/LPS O-acetylase OafA/YrhL